MIKMLIINYNDLIQVITNKLNTEGESIEIQVKCKLNKTQEIIIGKGCIWGFKYYFYRNIKNNRKRVITSVNTKKELLQELGKELKHIGFNDELLNIDTSLIDSEKEERLYDIFSDIINNNINLENKSYKQKIINRLSKIYSQYSSEEYWNRSLYDCYIDNRSDKGKEIMKNIKKMFKEIRKKETKEIYLSNPEIFSRKKVVFKIYEYNHISQAVNTLINKNIGKGISLIIKEDEEGDYEEGNYVKIVIHKVNKNLYNVWISKAYKEYTLIKSNIKEIEEVIKTSENIIVKWWGYMEKIEIIEEDEEDEEFEY